jgi:hypothetical protein
MYIQVTRSMFQDEMFDEGFSYEAVNLLFDYLDQDDTELDVVAIRCEFEETDEDEIRENFGLDENEDIEEFLEYNSPLYLGQTSSGFVYMSF